MKKIVSILMAFCILFIATCTIAESVTTGDPLELDDFCLNLDRNIYYTLREKELLQTCIQVFPYYSNGDNSNFSFVWSDVFQIDTSMLKSQIPQIEELFVNEFAPLGLEVASIVSTEPYEYNLAGVSCCAFDSTLAIVNPQNSQTVEVFQRQIHVGSKGYVITIASFSKDSLEKITTMLSSKLTWK